MCYRCLHVPNRSHIKDKFWCTIKGAQWYGLGTRAPNSYHSVIFLTNHNLSAPKFTNLMLWSNQDNNNNTGHLLHAISPKSKEDIACYKHITTHPTAQLIKD